MRKKIRIGVTALGVITLAVILYYTGVIIIARSNTPEIVSKALNAKNSILKTTDLTQWQLNVLLAIEDPGFYHHKGVDFYTPGAGITTITQGLVKLFYFENFKPGIAKLKQALIARFALDPLTSKDDQLTMFINYMYLGEVGGKRVTGLQDAAYAYYHKPFKELNGDEYIALVAMIIAPQNFHIINKPAQNKERCKRIKKVLAGTYIPKSLMDVYYGELDAETQQGLPKISYCPSIYK